MPFGAPGPIVLMPGRLSPSRRQLQFRLRFALGLSLVSGGVFMRLKLAWLDLVIMVEHRAGGCLVSSETTSTTRPLFWAIFQTSAAVG